MFNPSEKSAYPQLWISITFDTLVICVYPNILFSIQSLDWRLHTEFVAFRNENRRMWHAMHAASASSIFKKDFSATPAATSSGFVTALVPVSLRCGHSSCGFAPPLRATDKSQPVGVWYICIVIYLICIHRLPIRHAGGSQPERMSLPEVWAARQTCRTWRLHQKKASTAGIPSFSPAFQHYVNAASSEAAGSGAGSIPARTDTTMRRAHKCPLSDSGHEMTASTSTRRRVDANVCDVFLNYMQTIWLEVYRKLAALLGRGTVFLASPTYNLIWSIWKNLLP